MSVSPEVQYILNTFSFLMSGVLVMWMAAGFAMLEAGAVRTKNVSTILLKNISLFSIAGLMFYGVGYSLMYTGVSDSSLFGLTGLVGEFGLWDPGTVDKSAGSGSNAGRGGCASPTADRSSTTARPMRCCRRSKSCSPRSRRWPGSCVSASPAASMRAPGGGSSSRP